MTIQTTFRDIFGNVSKLCRPRELMTFEMVCMTPWLVALWVLNAFKIGLSIIAGTSYTLGETTMSQKCT